jgi:hypothetical protein
VNVELRERSFGELIGLNFQLAVAHFGKLLVIVLLLGLPGLAAQLLTQLVLLKVQDSVLIVLLVILAFDVEQLSALVDAIAARRGESPGGISPAGEGGPA